MKVTRERFIVAVLIMATLAGILSGFFDQYYYPYRFSILGQPPPSRITLNIARISYGLLLFMAPNIAIVYLMTPLATKLKNIQSYMNLLFYITNFIQITLEIIMIIIVFFGLRFSAGPPMMLL